MPALLRGCALVGRGPRGVSNTIAGSGFMSAPLDLVIFDCDGVLVDSEPLSNAVLAAALTGVGLPTSAEEAIATYKGLHIRDVLARAEASLGHALPDDFESRYERDRAEAFRRDLAPVPGAARAVTVVREAGVGVCVASQGKRSKTELSLTLCGLRSLFGPDAVFSAHSVSRGKPHPDLFLHAAAAMGAPPERTAVVEDTTIGVRAAVAAGMRAFGYAADSDPAQLASAGAKVIDRLAELPERLGLSPAGD